MKPLAGSRKSIHLKQGGIRFALLLCELEGIEEITVRVRTKNMRIAARQALPEAQRQSQRLNSANCASKRAVIALMFVT